MTHSLLRPDPALLGAEWKALVEAEYAQTERLREWQESDYYRPLAGHFVDDPRRPGDALLNRLRSFCGPDVTWLDVGAGGGRNALPLALLSKQVTAIEPSAAMREALAASAIQHGVENVEIIDLRWPNGSEQIEVDFSLMSHVGYDIREINPFIDGLERATRRRCFASLMDRAPSSGFERLWPAVHGEERVVLPAMREFIHLLLARGATPDVRIYPRDVEPFTADQIRSFARRRLWLVEGSVKDQFLQRIVDDELARVPGDLQQPRIVSLISWEPGRPQ
ncbi:MAG TPA: methyltransferase domain-containing protein [Nitrolancea sp.]|nr:methyltransferase domain-containing protein [Nitrolancea sp.]